MNAQLEEIEKVSSITDCFTHFVLMHCKLIQCHLFPKRIHICSVLCHICNRFDVVIQSKVELAVKLKKAEEYKAKMFEREEVNDEIQGLAAQETAKIKHMVRLVQLIIISRAINKKFKRQLCRLLLCIFQLINSQEELSKCKADLAEKTEKLRVSEKAVKDLKNEVQSLMQQIAEQTTRK